MLIKRYGKKTAGSSMGIDSNLRPRRSSGEEGGCSSTRSLIIPYLPVSLFIHSSSLQVLVRCLPPRISSVLLFCIFVSSLSFRLSVRSLLFRFEEVYTLTENAS